MDATYNVPGGADRLQRLAFIAGAVALVVVALAAFLSHEGLSLVFRAYLVGFVFWTGIAIGSLALLMLQHLSGGAWGMVIRRPLEAATRTLPLLAVMFLPLVVALFVHPGGHALWEWSHHEAVAADKILQHKATYLNVPFFLGRAVFYFAVWGVMIYFLNKWSEEQDHSGDPRIKRRLQSLSGPGLVLFGLTVTFAGVDWLMSLEPHWFSTIYGMLVMAGWGLSALAFIILVLGALSGQEPMSRVYAPAHFQDLGKLLLAFVMVYAYFSFSQFLIIWAGNLPEEIPWYLRRTRGGWDVIGILLVVIHFALPFIMLLSRDLKRNARRLVWVAALVILARMVDMVYLVAPAFHHEGQPVHVNPWDFLGMFAAMVGLGGIWLAFYIRQLKRRPLLPLLAPDVENVLNATTHH